MLNIKIYSNYVVNAADLNTVIDGNIFVKYAERRYIITPRSNIDSRNCELENIDSWSWSNNLSLNRSKPVEIVFFWQQATSATTSFTSTSTHHTSPQDIKNTRSHRIG